MTAVPFVLSCAALVGLQDQPARWADFEQLVQQAVPRTGSVLLLYEVVDPGVFGRDLVGIDFGRGDWVRIHGGNAQGVSPSGQQFVGGAVDGVSWTNDLPVAKGQGAMFAAPSQLLRLALDRPEVVESLAPARNGGFVFQIRAVGGIPGGSEADLSPAAVPTRETWTIEVGADGRITRRSGGISVAYSYAEDPWPVAFELIGTELTTHWELTRVDALPPGTTTPAGVMELMRQVETRFIEDPVTEGDDAAKIRGLDRYYERTPARRWSLALVIGGLLVLILGAGILIRRRIAMA